MRAMMRKNRWMLAVIGVLFIVTTLRVDVFCQTRVRSEPKIPDLPGYVTLKCDFHMHTVFSDGDVWPTVRVEEAWRQGLDAFSITDHIEYHPHKPDVLVDHNRPYEIAQPGAEVLNLIFVRGGEITRRMPPGHFNAIFLKDTDLLDTPDFMDAVKAAISQGAFVFWNHPGWTGQQPDGVSRWYPVHTELYEKGWLHGIEVVNGPEYYPAVHQWCLEKKLTMIGTSDVHSPINLDYDFGGGEHRPMTLVFAKERTAEALKEALFARRTAVYWNHSVIGEDMYLRPMFGASIEIINPGVTIKGKGRATIQIRNKSDIPFRLTAAGEVEDVSVPRNITLYADKTVSFRMNGKSETLSEKRRVRIPYEVKNLMIAPEEGLKVEFGIEITFMPADKKR